MDAPAVITGRQQTMQIRFRMIRSATRLMKVKNLLSMLNKRSIKTTPLLELVYSQKTGKDIQTRSGFLAYRIV